MVLYGNYLICIFMNINDNLKIRTKLLQKLEPKGLIRPSLNSLEYFFMPNGSKNGKKLCSSIINPLKAKLACHPARCLLPVEILDRCGLATGPANVELLTYLLPY